MLKIKTLKANMGGNNLNLIAAIVLSIGILVGWRYFFERPRILAATDALQKYESEMGRIKEAQLKTEHVPMTRNEAIVRAKRVPIISETLRGSISLQGLRFDDLTLMNYKETIAENSSNVHLLSPAASSDAYFAEVGWHSKSKDLILPNDQTIFASDKEELRPGSDITLTWTNPDNIVFAVNIAMDQDYMFTIKQSVVNNSNRPISLEPYGLIHRHYVETEKAIQILHQGPIAAINGELKDPTFADLKDKKTERMNNVGVDWIGITDKYWLTAFVPDATMRYNTSFSYSMQNATDKFQVDFLGTTQVVEQGGHFDVVNRLFAGAKKVGLLDKYEKDYDIKLFDRAIDFGMFYVLTKPVFNALNFFYEYCGNFGISILIVTVLVKLAMLTMSSRSYKAMKKMKVLQPEIDRLKSLYADDKARFNQEIMELYRREKVNPVAGCLPILIQIPVFFSLYKVLYVTIEMRQAPFFGWIKDLSAPDPTTAFNLFGLLSFTPPSFLMIGVWPLLMAGTMYLQQRMSPEPADPMQAQIMRFMPLMFLFMFSSFPAGLLIYWTWNNILSMVQQYYVNRFGSR